MKANPLDVTQYIMENSRYGIGIIKVYSLLYLINGLHLAINNSPMMDLEFYPRDKKGGIRCDFLPPELKDVNHLYAPELTVGNSGYLTAYQQYFVQSITRAYNLYSSIQLNELAQHISVDGGNEDPTPFATSTEQIQKCFDAWYYKRQIAPKHFKN